MNPIEFSFELTQADLFRAQRWYLIRRSRLWLLLMPLLANLYLAFASPGSMPAESFGFSIALAVVFLLMLLWFPWQRFRNSPPGQRRLRGSFGEDRFELASEVADFTAAWSVFSGFTARSESLYVFTAPGNFHVIPRRAFASDDDFAAAKRLAEQKIVPRPGRPYGKLLLWAVLILTFFVLFAIFSRQHGPGQQQRPAAGSR